MKNQQNDICFPKSSCKNLVTLSHCFTKLIKFTEKVLDNNKDIINCLVNLFSQNRHE